MRLFKTNDDGIDGVEASLYDLAAYWIQKYPEDVFTGATKDSNEIIKIRKAFQQILKKKGQKCVIVDMTEEDM